MGEPNPPASAKSPAIPAAVHADLKLAIYRNIAEQTVAIEKDAKPTGWTIERQMESDAHDPLEIVPPAGYLVKQMDGHDMAVPIMLQDDRFPDCLIYDPKRIEFQEIA